MQHLTRRTSNLMIRRSSVAASSLRSSSASSSSFVKSLISSSSSSSSSHLLPSRSYHDRVIDHYENPRNVGSLPKTSDDVGTGVVGAPACGDVMKLQLRVDETTGIITEAVFKTFGCGSAIASSSLATSWAQGKHIDEVIKIKNTDIAKHLSLPPVKLHCSMLAEDGLKAAVADYQQKQLNKLNATKAKPVNATIA